MKLALLLLGKLHNKSWRAHQGAHQASVKQLIDPRELRPRVRVPSSINGAGRGSLGPAKVVSGVTQF